MPSALQSWQPAGPGCYRANFTGMPVPEPAQTCVSKWLEWNALSSLARVQVSRAGGQEKQKCVGWSAPVTPVICGTRLIISLDTPFPFHVWAQDLPAAEAQAMIRPAFCATSPESKKLHSNCIWVNIIPDKWIAVTLRIPILQTYPPDFLFSCTTRWLFH